MLNVFISYRRSDSRAITERIYDRLITEFGKEHIFKDIDSIPAGRDFRGVLQEAVAKCDVQLVIIGNQWLSIEDDDGNRRLDNPNDFVRIEVQSALQRDRCLIIPVLVDNSEMPHAGNLPDSLRQLAFRNAINVGNDPDFHRDVDKLIDALKAHESAIAGSSTTKAKSIDSNTRTAVIAGIFAIIAAIIAGIFGLWEGVFSNSNMTPTTVVAQVANPTLTLQPTSETMSESPTPEQPTITATAQPSATERATETEHPTLTYTVFPNATNPATIVPMMSDTDNMLDFNGHPFVRVPAGTFQGEVVPEIWIMMYEVTNAEFATFLQSRDSLISREGQGRYATDSAGSRIEQVNNEWQVAAGYEDHPATRVTWYGARDYCEWVDARLPTGTEWHKAAAWDPETNNASTYPWGEQAPDDTLAQFSSNDTALVDAHPAGRSPVGAYNMAGNAIEWSADTRGINRFLRGGGYEDIASALRASSSTQVTHTHSSPATGFRCVIDG